jgi:lipoprotein-anchoring transpeptidase ErfK/SrfK
MRLSSSLLAACAVAATVSATASAATSSVEILAAEALYAGGSEVATPAGGFVLLHATPGSARILARVDAETEFGSDTHLAVVKRGSIWSAVISPALDNGVVGWVRTSDVRFSHSDYALEVDLSQRQLSVWRDGERRRSVSVAIGRSSSPTPTGRFSVTDKLVGFNPAAYGCCILALSGHQENLPAGWPGGDRLAIHGGSGIGSADSAGCLRAGEDDLHYLLARLPLGTQVVIHP